jgi:hypothetical protein
MDEGRTLLEALREESLAAARGQMEAVRSELERLEEVLWTCDLYLGKDEEIVRLRKGKAAPPDEKIIIRQLVLYMDEESALVADRGGIDFQEIGKFDDWVAEPEHLQQILPESKGIVALKVRRHDLDYGDDKWASTEKNKLNAQTYWLIRNGDNLYRIQTDLMVGKHVIPLEGEFIELFSRSGFSWEKRRNERTPIRPGDSDYMEAMKAADTKKRHYMRIMLFFQGLIDRTAIFRPYPHDAKRINVLDERYHSQYISYVLDAEPHKLLGHGRIPYSDWITSMLRQVQVGHRIMGVFNTYSVLRDIDREEHRRSPRHAHRPNDLTIYTIDSQPDKDEFKFLYDYERWHGQKSEKRASYRIRIGDSNILPIDLASIEDIEFYLSDRLNRHAYLTMFPLLKTALEVKRLEDETEAPFKQLLTGQIMKLGVSREDASKDIDELVRWWKFKNREHRALTSDDRKALKMILAEFKLRSEKNTIRAKLDHNAICASILKHTPDTIYIGHKTERQWVSFVPHNDQNVFVREYTWEYSREQLRLLETKDWKTVDSRRQRWMAVHKTERWSQWLFDARPELFLTDQELSEGVNYLMSVIANNNIAPSWPNRHGKPCRKLLAITVDEHQELHAYVQNTRPSTPEDLLCDALEPSCCIIRATWERRRDGLSWSSRTTQVSEYRQWWIAEQDAYSNGGHGTRRILKINHDNIAACDTDWRILRTAKDRRGRIDRMQSDISRLVVVALAKSIEENARSEFMNEHHDEELWLAESKKTNWERKVTTYGECAGLDAIRFLLAKRVDCNGMLLTAVLRLAGEMGWKPDPDGYANDTPNVCVQYDVLDLDADMIDDEDEDIDILR